MSLDHCPTGNSELLSSKHWVPRNQGKTEMLSESKVEVGMYQYARMLQEEKERALNLLYMRARNNHKLPKDTMVNLEFLYPYPNRKIERFEQRVGPGYNPCRQKRIVYCIKNLFVTPKVYTA